MLSAQGSTHELELGVQMKAEKPTLGDLGLSYWL